MMEPEATRCLNKTPSTISMFHDAEKNFVTFRQPFK
jgi:hypothetical protein